MIQSSRHDNKDFFIQLLCDYDDNDNRKKRERHFLAMVKAFGLMLGMYSNKALYGSENSKDQMSCCKTISTGFAPSLFYKIKIGLRGELEIFFNVFSSLSLD